MSESEVIKVRWYNAAHIVGIVVIKLGPGHGAGLHKAYIGTGTGISEAYDIQQIREHGARMHDAYLLFPDIKDWYQG